MTSPVCGNEDMNYVKCAVRFWDLVLEGNPKGANKETKRCDLICKRWQKQGSLQAHLHPFLLHERDEVRYAAAAHLMTLANDELGRAELRRLAIEGKGLIASTAKLLLTGYATRQ